MKLFIRKTALFLIILFVCVELLSRLVIDPFYFFSLNTYNSKSSKKEVFKFKKTKHVDYLFIGSSRVPATINPDLIMKKNPKKIAIVAGRGYMTEGVHYQALENRLLEYPNYIKGAKVFIEYAGFNNYSSSFSENKLKVYEPIVSIDKAMPQLLLPHLNFNSLISFLKESKNSRSVKMDMVFLYYFSSYRTIPFIKERFKNGCNRLINNNKHQLVADGGIRNDNIEIAKKKALDVVMIQSNEIEKKPVLTSQALDKSSLAYFNNLINRSGGKLYLYRVPLNSIQAAIFNTKKAKQNTKVFEEWLTINGITVIQNEKFHYKDSDFPDIWHLAENRRDEFTMLLFDEIMTRTSILEPMR